MFTMMLLKQDLVPLPCRRDFQGPIPNFVSYVVFFFSLKGHHLFANKFTTPLPRISDSYQEKEIQDVDNLRSWGNRAANAVSLRPSILLTP